MMIILTLVFIIVVILILNKKQLFKPINHNSKNGSQMKGKVLFDNDIFAETYEHSDNHEYSIRLDVDYCVTPKKGKLTLLKDNLKLFQKTLEKPESGAVSNQGFIAVCDYLFTQKLEGIFYIFDNIGNKIFYKRTTANLGVCSISSDSQYSMFETYGSETEDSNKIFVIDVSKCEIISKFDKPFGFNKVMINSNKSIKLINHKNIIFEIDFYGNQINKDEYKKLIFETGSILDKLNYFEKSEVESILTNKDYLALLKAGINDNDTSYSYGKGLLYRKIGDYYEYNGDKENTIKYWEEALKINPKIGVKRKLESMKKK